MAETVVTFMSLDDYTLLSVLNYCDLVDRVVFERVNRRLRDLLRQSMTVLDPFRARPRLSDHKLMAIEVRGLNLALRYPNLRELAIIGQLDPIFPNRKIMISYATKLATCCPKLKRLQFSDERLTEVFNHARRL